MGESIIETAVHALTGGVLRPSSESSKSSDSSRSSSSSDKGGSDSNKK